jgi:hypothetical protein
MDNILVQGFKYCDKTKRDSTMAPKRDMYRDIKLTSVCKPDEVIIESGRCHSCLSGVSLGFLNVVGIRSSGAMVLHCRKSFKLHSAFHASHPPPSP